MLVLDCSIGLADSPAKIEKMLNLAIRDELNKVIPTLIPAIKTEIAIKTKPFFTSSKTYDALINGPLNADFGFPRGEERKIVDEIINTIVKNLDVSFKPISYNGKGFSGGITVGVIVLGYMDILGKNEAQILTEKGQYLPWLEWLTLRGSQIIISDYKISFGDFSDPKFHSRSEKALMVPVSGTFWRVPTSFAGTSRDNWLTRSIIETGDAWADMIGQVIKYHIEN